MTTLQSAIKVAQKISRKLKAVPLPPPWFLGVGVEGDRRGGFSILVRVKQGCVQGARHILRHRGVHRQLDGVCVHVVSSAPKDL